MMEIREGGLDDPDVISLLQFHFDYSIAITPAGSAHVFDISRLQSSDIKFWSVWDGDELLGFGALKIYDTDHGEIKSMHVAETARGRGVGKAILIHIIDQARTLGLKRLSLETGSFDDFSPARALYLSQGFVECEPFCDYKEDPNSTFMTREI